MEGICGANCEECSLKNKCKGCKNTNGCPFGKQCFIAEYINTSGKEQFEAFKKELINEFNSLHIEGLGKINELYPLNGSFVNLEYLLPNGMKVKFINDDESYLGSQVECEFNVGKTKKYFGLLASNSFLLVSEYEEGGINPEIVIFKRR